MKKGIILLPMLLAVLNLTYGQKPVMELVFTAIDSADYVQLDSIKVMNRTQGGDTTLYWPDTVLVLDYQVGVPELNPYQEKLQVFQNYPNPVVNQTTISLYVPEKDEVGIIITDILGREILKIDRVLEKGVHFFRFAPGSGSLFFFSAQWRGSNGSIKILQTTSNSNRASSLKYISSNQTMPQIKATDAIQSFTFSIGDTLLYTGFTDTLQSGILDAPEASETYIFQFATNIPCLGTPTVTYEGQVYNTIQIFSQCWLKENLNAGIMIPGADAMTDNGIMEKYCYENEPDSCTKYGGLYLWHEMMQYTTMPGVQGICPPDWHLPTDEEYMVLEGATDSQYGIGDQTWNSLGNRGFDAGTYLKTSSGWYDGGNGIDLFGFSGLPGGYRGVYGFFFNIGNYGGWWAFMEDYTYHAMLRNLNYDSPEVYRSEGYEGFGFSVRCLKDSD